MALTYWCYTLSWKHGQLLAGIIGGLFLFFRPTVVLFLLAFLLKKRFQFIFGAIIGVTLGMLIFVAPFVALWKDYFHAINEYSNIAAGKPTIFSSASYSLQVKIEGLNDITKFHTFDTGGIVTISYYLFLVSGVYISGSRALIFLAGAVAILMFLFLRAGFKENKPADTDKLFLVGFLFYIFAEIFTVVPRAGYNLVQWIFPVLIGWRYIYHFKWHLALFFTGLIFIRHFLFVFQFQQDIGELLWIVTIALCSLKQIKVNERELLL